MSITSVKTLEEKDSVPRYPYIGIHSDESMIVLFTGAKSGVALHVLDEEYQVGDYAHDWREHEFRLFHGQVTLQNA